MKRIAIDMDEVIADFHPKILATWNNHLPGSSARKNLTCLTCTGTPHNSWPSCLPW
nr:hypothetical protein [Erwinia amylovora]